MGKFGGGERSCPSKRKMGLYTARVICSTWIGFIKICQCDLLSSILTSLFHFLLFSVLLSPCHLLFSLHDTTRRQPQVLAPRLPLPHLLFFPQMTPPAPPMSWPRSGFAMSGGCKIAKVWMKSAKRVEVDICRTDSVFFLLA